MINHQVSVGNSSAIYWSSVLYFLEHIYQILNLAADLCEDNDDDDDDDDNDSSIEVSGSMKAASKRKQKTKSKSSSKKNPKKDQAALCSYEEAENLENKEDRKEEGGNEIEVFPSKIVALHRVRWNMNKGSEGWLCYGGAAGIVRCQKITAGVLKKDLVKR